MTFGNWLGSVRAKHKITYRQMSEATGLSAGYLCELEKGNSSPTLATLEALASAFGCTVWQMLKRAGI